MSRDFPDSSTLRATRLATELRVLLGQLNRRLREQAGAADLTSSQKSVILRLERDGPATISVLARAERVRPQSMGATIAALQAAGMLKSSSDPADGRQTILSLSPKCRQLIQAKREAREDWLHRAIQAKLTQTEQKHLAASIELLKRLADS